MDLRHIRAIDCHAHNIWREDALQGFPYSAAFTEGYHPAIVERHARNTLFYQRSIREIAAIFGCEVAEEAIAIRRKDLGFDRTAALCFDSAYLEEVFLDDGFRPDQSVSWDYHKKFVPVRRIVRIEHLAESLIGSCRDFNEFIERFIAGIDPLPPGVVALKSIAGYRTGLDIAPVPAGLARQRFELIGKSIKDQSPRLSDKPLVDYLFNLALDAASRQGIPFQIHTGFGDPDLDLRLNNPLHLRPIFEAKPTAPIVLLHAGYPFVRETAYLSSVYPGVHADIGLAVPFLSVGGMKRVLGGLLELAPISKIMYSSDAHVLPELFYLAARWGRMVLAQVLEEAVSDSDLSAAQSDLAAEAILAGNARQLYFDR